jgi:hypothetical protein
MHPGRLASLHMFSGMATFRTAVSGILNSSLVLRRENEERSEVSYTPRWFSSLVSRASLNQSFVCVVRSPY